MQKYSEFETGGGQCRILENIPRRIFPRKYFERELRA